MGHYRKKQIALSMTNRCNLRCQYCFTAEAKDKHGLVIDRDFAECALRHYLLGDEEYREVRFYGIGEPTEAAAEMKAVREYVDSICGGVRFELQTNGAFSEAMAHWVGEFIDRVWISIDGPPDIQNRLRPHIGNGKSGPDNGKSCSEIVERNVRILRRYKLQRGEDFRLGARATVTDVNVGRMKDIADYFMQLGMDAGWVHHIFPVVGKANSHRSVAEQMVYSPLAYAENYLEVHEYAKAKRFFFGNFLAINFDEPVSIACRACLPAPYLTLDGYVSACDEAYWGGNPLFEDLIIGKYDKRRDRLVLYDDVIERLRNRRVGNIPDCAGCDVEQNCAGHCLGECNMCNGNIYKPRKELCGAIQYLAKHMELNAGPYKDKHP